MSILELCALTYIAVDLAILALRKRKGKGQRLPVSDVKSVRLLFSDLNRDELLDAHTCYRLTVKARRHKAFIIDGTPEHLYTVLRWLSNYDACVWLSRTPLDVAHPPNVPVPALAARKKDNEDSDQGDQP